MQDPSHKDWVEIINGQPTQVDWQNGAEADFPAAGTSMASPQVVPLSSTDVELVFASTIKFLKDPNGLVGSYYDFTTTNNGTADQLTLDPNGTTLEAQQTSAALPTVATFSTEIVTNASGPNSLTAASGGSQTGSFVIDSTTSVATLAVSAGLLQIGPNGNITATSVSVAGGAFGVYGNLSVTSSLSVSNNAVLQGVGTAVVTLASNCALSYTSSEPCDFTPQITGLGSFSLNSASLNPSTSNPDNCFTLDNAGNSYTGGTFVHAGTLRTGPFGGFAPGTNQGPLYLFGTSTFDVNGVTCDVLSLTGGQGTTITNSAAPNGQPPSVTIGGGASGISMFAGTTVAGSLGGDVSLSVSDSTLNLGSTANISQGAGILLDGATLNFDETGGAPVILQFPIFATHAKSSIIFHVAPTAPTTFKGTIASDIIGLDVSMYGPGTLTLTPAAASIYWTLYVYNGTLLCGNANAIAAGSSIGIDAGATLDGGGRHDLAAFNDITLYSGTITDGTFAALGSFVVYSGTIGTTATLNVAAALDKEIWYSDTDTVYLNGMVNANSAKVGGGTLQVVGTLDPSTGTEVYAGATLQLGDGASGHDATLPGNVVDNGSLVFDIYSPSYPNVTYNISGSGKVVKQGAGTVTFGTNALAVTNTYTGGTTVAAGELIVLHASGIADGTSLTVGDPSAFAAPLAPEIVSLQYNGPAVVGAGLLTYVLTLNESVTGIAASDFAIDASGVSGLVTSVTQLAGNKYLITVMVSGSGSLALTMTSAENVTDASGKTIPPDALPIASSTALVDPTLYRSKSGDWTGEGWTLADGTPIAWLDGANIVISAGVQLTLNGTVHVSSITALGSATIDGGTIYIVTPPLVATGTTSGDGDPPSPYTPLPEGEGGIDVASGVLRISSTISDAAAWSKLGDGILVVEGPLDYTGTATVTAGTLLSATPFPSAVVVAGGQVITIDDVLANRPDWLNFAPAVTQLVPALYARDGSISYVDMIQVLEAAIQPPAPLLAGEGSYVDDATLAALDIFTSQTVAASLGELQYVEVLASNIVQGSLANSGVGFLAVQTTDAARATVLTSLIGQWMFGEVLPEIPSWASYCVTAGSLYGAAGAPSSADVRQGGLGDCYFCSSLGAISDSSPAAIENAIFEVAPGVYTVRFYWNQPGVGYTADYVTVNSLLPGNAYGNTVFAHPGADGSWWLPIMEKAYAAWNATGHEGRDGQAAYESLTGGFMGAVDAQILGRPAMTYYLWGASAANLATAQQALIAALQNGDVVNAAIFGSGTRFAQLGLVSSHAYEIIAFDPDPDSPTYGIQLRNPWGFADPTQRLTWADFVAYCGWFNVADASGTTPASAADASSVATPSAAAVNGYIAQSVGGDTTESLAPDLRAIDAVMARYFSAT